MKFMAAAQKKINNYSPRKGKVRRPGVHSKNSTSFNKTSKNYVKPYKGQGK